jgi:beta-N-acetylhexosaminidase
MIPSRYKRIMIVSVSGLSAGVMGTMMAKYMGGGKKSPAERLRDKLIEKGFDAFIYESPLDALAKRAAAGEKVNEASVAVSLVDANGNLFIARA